MQIDLIEELNKWISDIFQKRQTVSSHRVASVSVQFFNEVERILIKAGVSKDIAAQFAETQRLLWLSGVTFKGI